MVNPILLVQEESWVKEYLKERIGEVVGITRTGIPKEVYFEGKLKAVEGGVAVLEDERGRIFGIALDKIILVGPAEEQGGAEKVRPGFKGGR